MSALLQLIQTREASGNTAGQSACATEQQSSGICSHEAVLASAVLANAASGHDAQLHTAASYLQQLPGSLLASQFVQQAQPVPPHEPQQSAAAVPPGSGPGPASPTPLTPASAAASKSLADMRVTKSAREVRITPGQRQVMLGFLQSDDFKSWAAAGTNTRDMTAKAPQSSLRFQLSKKATDPVRA